MKYPTLVTDQESNVVKATKILRWNHLACFAHKVNLCLTAYGLDKVLDCSKLVIKCQTLAVYCRRRRNQFSQKQKELRSFYDNFITSDHTYFKQLDVPNTSVKINVSTRWHSICIMIQSILENEATINNFLIDHQKDCLVLSPDDLEGCSNLVAFLKLHFNYIFEHD